MPVRQRDKEGVTIGGPPAGPSRRRDHRLDLVLGEVIPGECVLARLDRWPMLFSSFLLASADCRGSQLGYRAGSPDVLLLLIRCRLWTPAKRTFRWISGISLQRSPVIALCGFGSRDLFPFIICPPISGGRVVFGLHKISWAGCRQNNSLRDLNVEGAVSSSPSGPSGSAPVGSSTIGSHTVSGGHFPPQPLNFPPEVNQGPGCTVPEGPYRPLRPSAEPSTKKVPAGNTPKD